MFPIFLSCNVTVYKYLLNYVQNSLVCDEGAPAQGSYTH